MTTDSRIATIREYISDLTKSVPQGDQEETRGVLVCLASLEKELVSLQADNDMLFRSTRDGLLSMSHDDLVKLFGDDWIVQSSKRVKTVIDDAIGAVKSPS